MNTSSAGKETMVLIGQMTGAELGRASLLLRELGAQKTDLQKAWRRLLEALPDSKTKTLDDLVAEAIAAGDYKAKRLAADVKQKLEKQNRLTAELAALHMPSIEHYAKPLGLTVETDQSVFVLRGKSGPFFGTERTCETLHDVAAIIAQLHSTASH